MSVAPREPDPAPDPTSQLREYLADHDALCPYCKYNLRGIPASRCPECASNLDLELVRDGTEAEQRPQMFADSSEPLGPELSHWWLLLVALIFLAALIPIIAFLFGWVR